MPKEETLRDVLTDKVGSVVQGFVDDGARDVNVVINTNGKWNVTAHFK